MLMALKLMQVVIYFYYFFLDCAGFAGQYLAPVEAPDREMDEDYTMVHMVD